MEAKVIKIISDKQIVLNAGTDKGVNEGDIFQIIDKVGDQVFDPDSGELLGSLDLPKAILRVELVYPRMCICTNNENKSILGPAIEFNMTVTKPLNVNLNQVSGGFNNSKTSPIQIGDLAHSIY